MFYLKDNGLFVYGFLMGVCVCATDEVNDKALDLKGSNQVRKKKLSFGMQPTSPDCTNYTTCLCFHLLDRPVIDLYAFECHFKFENLKL